MFKLWGLRRSEKKIAFNPKLPYYTLLLGSLELWSSRHFHFFTADQKCHLAFFRPIFYDLAWSLFFLFFTWGWWESQTISLKCQNLLSSQMFNGDKLAVASVARATPLFLPRPEIININVLHYSAQPRTYLLCATLPLCPDWRHWATCCDGNFDLVFYRIQHATIYSSIYSYKFLSIPPKRVCLFLLFRSALMTSLFVYISL